MTVSASILPDNFAPSETPAFDTSVKAENRTEPYSGNSRPACPDWKLFQLIPVPLFLSRATSHIKLQNQQGRPWRSCVGYSSTFS